MIYLYTTFMYQLSTVETFILEFFKENVPIISQAASCMKSTLIYLVKEMIHGIGIIYSFKESCPFIVINFLNRNLMLTYKLMLGSGWINHSGSGRNNHFAPERNNHI